MALTAAAEVTPSASHIGDLSRLSAAASHVAGNISRQFLTCRTATFDRTLKGLDTFKILIQPLSCRSVRDRLTNADEVSVPVQVPSNDKDGQERA